MPIRSHAHMRAVASARALPLGAGGLPLLAIAAAAFAVQQGAIRLLPAAQGYEALRQAAFLVTTAAVLYVALRLRTLIGAWLVAIGIVLNCVPMLAHGGTMPVAWETVSSSGAFPEITEQMLGNQLAGSKDVLLMRDEIRFEWLSDRYYVDPPIYRPNIYSLGDFVIFGGVALAAVECLLWAVRARLPGTSRRTVHGPVMVE